MEPHTADGAAGVSYRHNRIVSMLAMGYEVATLLGWSATEAIFFGGGAVDQQLGDYREGAAGQRTLLETHGRLIVGILVVEDFAAVLLLSVLSRRCHKRDGEHRRNREFDDQLGIFFLCALFAGALLAPRIINFVARFESREALLIISLAMCFGLALIGEDTGDIGCCGGFHYRDGAGGIRSIRKELTATNGRRCGIVFAALFFISIGMLIDLSLLAEFIVPSLIIAAVFMAGKTVALTLGTFIAGHDGKTSLSVGMGSPQLGEFSLAMTKVGRITG